MGGMTVNWFPIKKNTHLLSALCSRNGYEPKLPPGPSVGCLAGKQEEGKNEPLLPHGSQSGLPLPVFLSKKPTLGCLIKVLLIWP